MKRILFVVSRMQLDLIPRLEKECRGDSVEIIVDRRFGERRKKNEMRLLHDRRHSERRTHPNTSDLDLIGIAVAVLP